LTHNEKRSWSGPKCIGIEIWQVAYQIEGNYINIVNLQEYNDYLIIPKGYYMWCVLFLGIKQLKFTLMNGLYVKKIQIRIFILFQIQNEYILPQTWLLDLHYKRIKIY